MRLSALLMLADYLDVEDTDPDVSRRIRGLRVPHWQEWSFLADELARLGFPYDDLAGLRRGVDTGHQLHLRASAQPDQMFHG